MEDSRLFVEGSPGSSPSRHITVVDVYDLAAAIGKDFEHLIDQYGVDCVRSLMPKVISSLETLESLASNNERENEEILALKKAVDRLQDDKVTKMQDRVKFERELEQIEENYRKEIDELWVMVKSLQNENKHLNSSLSDQEEPMSPTTLRDEDLKMMTDMRVQVDKQKDQLKQIERELADKSAELDNLHNELEKLCRQNKELQRKYKTIQNQGRILVEEKCELISQLQNREEQYIGLQHKLVETDRARKDLEQTKADDKEPHFTLAELREVLHEKNTLKARVMELEEELEALRPKIDKSPMVEEEELVYGPINREPDEKLYPWKYQRNNSGVRKFFSSLYSRRSTNRQTRADTDPSTSKHSWPKTAANDQLLKVRMTDVSSSALDDQSIVWEDHLIDFNSRLQLQCTTRPHSGINAATSGPKAIIMSAIRKDTI